MTEQARERALSRAAKIAAIHAAADWLAAHPEEEFDRVIISRTTFTHEEIDEALRVAPVLAFAARHNEQATEDDYAVSCWHTLTEDNGIRIVLLRKATLNYGTTYIGRYVK